MNDTIPLLGSSQGSELTSSLSQILDLINSSGYYLHKTDRIPKKRRYAIGVGANHVGCQQNHCCPKGVAVLCQFFVHGPDVALQGLQGGLLDRLDASQTEKCA